MGRGLNVGRSEPCDSLGEIIQQRKGMFEELQEVSVGRMEEARGRAEGRGL